MTYFKGGYPPLVGGVSQQVVHARLPNQVARQVNMLSDIVTGPRRRGGFRLVRELEVLPELLATDVVALGSKDVLLTVECSIGRLRVFSLDGSNTVLIDSTTPYLVATKTSSIRFVQHGNDIYTLNTEQTVTQGAAEAEASGTPENQGYFYVATGALGVTFDVIIDKAGVSHTVSHTTPESDATKAAPAYIATQLAAALRAHADVGTTAGYTYTQLGPYVHVQAPVGVRVTTSLGSHVLQVSNSSNVRDIAALPAKLPAIANGYVIRVGYGMASQYYSWDYADSAWKERAAYGLRKPITNLPVYIDAELLQLEHLVMKGRLAGDADNAPNPAFVGKKLTGLGTFQGRLVFLSGEYVVFSASDEPDRVFRAAIADLKDNDPIEVASTTTLGVSYEFAIPHNGDLLLTSENVQGLVSGRAILTPKTAVVSIAAQYKMQPGVRPVSTGKSILYPAHSSLGTSAVWELTPSEYTEQQITSHNITEHLPRYVVGTVRGISTSNTSGMAVVLDESSTLKVHQYLWDGATKKHSAFHEWASQEQIISAHIQLNLLYIVSVGVAGNVRVLEWDMVDGLGDQWRTVPKLDSYHQFNITVEGEVEVPKWMFKLEDLQNANVIAYGVSGQGTPYPYTIYDWTDTGTHWKGTSEYIKEGTLTLGYTYQSIFTPSAPVVRDFQGMPILTERAVLRSVTALFDKTGTLNVSVKDKARTFPVMQYTPLKMYSNDLDNGIPLATEGLVQIPMRTDLSSTEFSFSTTDIYDMNITAMEFDYRHNQRGKRAYFGGNE